MSSFNHIVGVKDILRNLKRKDEQLMAGYIRGLKRAGLMLQAASQKMVPVDTGNLKASAFTRVQGIGWKSSATVGYTAFYAIFVHEAVGMVLKGQPRPGGAGKYWDPQGRAQAKFLETPARQMRDQLRAVIKSSMK